MNAIDEAIRHVMFSMPREILTEAFLSKELGQLYQYGQAVSLEHRIKESVVVPQVLRDCNLYSGAEIVVKLNRCINKQIDRYNLIINIPLSETQGRRVTSALHIGETWDTGGQSFTGAGGPALLKGAQAMGDAYSSFRMPSEANITLIGENMLHVKNLDHIPTDGFVRVKVAYDNEMSDIKPATIPTFQELVVLAVKAFVYNTMVVRMDTGYQVGGVNLGVFREIIDGYADSFELYTTMLRERWAKASIMNDHEARSRHLKMITRSF